MASLLDIAPLTASVDVRGTTIQVGGLSVSSIGDLINRFPDLRKMIATGTFDLPSLLVMSEDVAAALVSAGAPEWISEDGARNLSLDEKVEIISAMAPLTFTRGVGPFVEALAKLMAAASGPDGASLTVPSTKSRKP